MGLGRRAFSVVLLAVAGAAVGCGGDGDQPSDAANQEAVEARIDRERDEAARIARQDERLKLLERELKEAKRAPRTRTVTAPGTASPPPAAATTATAPAGDDWPGGAAHTVILASVASEAEARALQRRASDAGLDAGVLFSSSYRSLRPGFWVAFSGTFPSSSAAAARQARARSLGFGDAYVRFVSP